MSPGRLLLVPELGREEGRELGRSFRREPTPRRTTRCYRRPLTLRPRGLPEGHDRRLQHLRRETGTKWTKGRPGLRRDGHLRRDLLHHYENGLTGFPGDPRRRPTSRRGADQRQAGAGDQARVDVGGRPLSGDVSGGFYRLHAAYENGSDNWRLADRLRGTSCPAARPANARPSCTRCTGQHLGARRIGRHLSPLRATCTPRPPRTAPWPGCWRTRTTSSAGGWPRASTPTVHGSRAVGGGRQHRGRPCRLQAARSRRTCSASTLRQPAGRRSDIDDHVSYVVCSAGLAKLQAALRAK